MKNHGSTLTACTTYLVASLPVQVLKVMTLSFTSNSRLVSPRVSFMDFIRKIKEKIPTD